MTQSAPTLAEGLESLADHQQLYITDDEFRAAYDAEAERFHGYGDQSYEPIFEAANEQLRDRPSRPSAVGVPAIQFVMQTTMRLLRTPGLYELLPVELSDRAGAVGDVSALVVGDAVRRGDFLASYRSRGPVGEAGRAHSDMLTDTSHTGYVRRYTRGVFDDVAWIGGGAIKSLEGTENPELLSQKVTTLQQSAGLIILTRLINNGYQAEIAAKLGYPYLHARYVNTDDAPSRLRPSQELREYIARYRGSGCPAAEMAGSAGGTLLQQQWPELIAFGVPEDATINQYNEPDSAKNPLS